MTDEVIMTREIGIKGGVPIGNTTWTQYVTSMEMYARYMPSRLIHLAGFAPRSSSFTNKIRSQ